MRATAMLLALVAAAAAQDLGAVPGPAPVDPAFARLRVPDLARVAKMADLYIVGDRKRTSLFDLARWVEARQRGETAKARALWKKLDRARLVRDLKARWPAAWNRGRRPDMAKAALRALHALASDAFTRRYAERRLAYIEKATTADWMPPGEGAAARDWVEGLRTAGIVSTCTTRPRLSDGHGLMRHLKRLGPAAYADLVVACEDPRPAGKFLSAWDAGELDVGAVARFAWKRLLGFDPKGDLPERWIQSGTHLDPVAGARWLAKARKK